MSMGFGRSQNRWVRYANYYRRGRQYYRRGKQAFDRYSPYVRAGYRAYRSYSRRRRY